MKQLFRTLTLCVLPLLAAACSTDYNFDKVSLEVTVGDTSGIVVPLGEIEKTTIGELLQMSGADLPTDENGNYGYSEGNSENPLVTTISVGNIPNITGLTPTISPVTESLLGGFSAKIEPFIGTKDIGIPAALKNALGNNATLPQYVIDLVGDTFPLSCDEYTFAEKFSITLPEQVASVKEVTFDSSVLEVTFDLGGLAGVNKECTINTLYFEFPEGFVIKELEGNALNAYTEIKNNNRFELKEPYTFTGSSVTIDIVLDRVSINKSPDSNHNVEISEDVTFALDASIKVKAGDINIEALPCVAISVTPSIKNATITTNEITHNFEFLEQIETSIDIPDIVSSIDYLNISNANSFDNSLPQFCVEVALAGSPVERLELRDVEISLPTFLDIETPANWNYADGKLTTDKLEVVNGQTNKLIELSLKGIKDLSIVDNKITLDSQIGLKATAAIAGGSELHIDTSAKELLLTPTITLDDLSITKVTGYIDPDFDNLLQIDPINLGDLSSSLGEGIDLELNIAAPVLKLEVENPIGVGIDADLTLVAYKGEDVVSTVTVEGLRILPAQTTIIAINGEAAPDVPNYLTYEADGLADMIAALPERIEVQLNAETNKEKPHELVLQPEYTFTVIYSIDAAFKFDSEKNGTISYTEVIDEVDLSMLADIDVVVENLTLNVASESTLPIDLSMDIELLDENGDPIECIASKTVGKIEGTTTEEAKLSECSIILDIEAKDGVSPFAEIARTKNINCHLSGTTLAGGALNANQYIAAKLSLELGEGITIDLGSLLNAEDDDTAE